jgi:hypothetical protein
VLDRAVLRDATTKVNNEQTVNACKEQEEEVVQVVVAQTHQGIRYDFAYQFGSEQDRSVQVRVTLFILLFLEQSG